MGPFDPFPHASLAPLADTLWAVTWAEEKQGRFFKVRRFMAALPSFKERREEGGEVKRKKKKGWLNVARCFVFVFFFNIL